VKEGETVRAGQVLLKFDSRLSQSDLQQARVRLEGQKNRLIQLRGMRNQLELTVSTQEFQSQAQAAEQQEQLALTQEALHSSEQSLILENNSLSVIQNDLERHQTLWNQGAISKSQLEEIKSKFIEQQKLLEQAQSGVERNRIELEKQHDASQRINRAGELAVIESQRQLKEVQSQIAEANSEMLQTQQQIQSAQFQLQQQTLRAPVNGTVFQFSVTNAGTVLREGQTITNIAPQGAPLILRAQMPTSQKSGFLREGMPVKLKFDSYPFQDYGIVPGHVKTISPDSKEIQTEQGKTQGFEIEVALDRTYIESQGDRHNLTPGQTATAEVVIRQRRVIDFILDPFKKLQKGGLAL
jgi:HlyD family secretion protein